MNKKLISLAIAGAVAAPFAAQAGSFTVGNQDIKVGGGITGGYVFTSDNTGHQDAFVVPDALVDLSSDAKTGGMGFTVGIGELAEPSLVTGTELNSAGGAGGVGIQYGWVSVAPVEGLKIDAGKIATNIGYEVSPTYGNQNMLLGLLWAAQPTYYTGARATYSMSGINVYAEVNKGALGVNNNSGAAIGASGNFSGVNLAVNFLNVANVGMIFDAIASTKVSNVTLGANFDYQKEASAVSQSGKDDNGFGAALYASMPIMDKVTLPVRVEFVHSGTSFTYNSVGGHGISFTVTPTYNFTDSTFARAEFAYVTTSNNVYANKNGNPTDSDIVLGVQGGVRF